MPETAARPDELEVDVEGMTCAACARRVEKALAKAEGVREARVDLVRERAVLVLADGAPAALARESAETAVEKAGYRLRFRDARALDAGRRDTRDLRTALAWLGTGIALATALAGLSWIELALSTAVVLIAGAPILRKAAIDLRDRSAGMDVLIAVGALFALGSAVLALALPAAHAHGSEHASAMQHSDASMAALIVSVALLGKTLERRAKERAASAIEAIVRAMPRTARVVRHGQEGEVAIDEVRAGDEVRVAPFSRVPVDGEILAEEAGAEISVSLDESVVTGESRPVERRAGERALGGSLNLGRALRMRVVSVGEDTELAQVVRAVSRAQASKTAIVRATDRISSIFAPLVLAIAAITFAGWLAHGAEPLGALRIAISVVVVACPCALGLATPVAVTVALGNLAGRGILVRDASILEVLPRVRTLVLDKTGTLTEGAPRVVAFELAAGARWSEEQVLARAASVEADSHHPLARAIFEEAMRRKLVVARASALAEEAGQGVSGSVEGVSVVVGRPRAEHDGSFMGERRSLGGSRVEIVIDGAPAARLELEDALRPEARDVVARLRARGLVLAIRSGDARAAVERVARALEITDARGEQRPDDKLADLASLPGPCAMIGDGINDAPALARADVGFALGTRAETALAAAGIALPRPDLALVLHALDVSRRAARVIRENLALAFAYNVVAIPFAASGAFDLVGGPAAAAVAMALSSLVVVLNALRLRDGRSRDGRSGDGTEGASTGASGPSPSRDSGVESRA